MLSYWCTPNFSPSTPGTANADGEHGDHKVNQREAAENFEIISDFNFFLCSRNASSLNPSDLLALIILVQDLYPSKIDQDDTPEV